MSDRQSLRPMASPITNGQIAVRADFATRFKPGNKASPGRPKSSRHKLSEAFLAALCDDFLEHGRAAITRVRDEMPDAYLKIIGSVIPKEIEVGASGSDWASELTRIMHQT